MAEGAKVTSISVLREFRPALIKFVDQARTSLIAAESECNRTLEWLRSDRTLHWKKQIRIRQDQIVRAKTDLINKQRSATGDPRSAVEERKALEKANQSLQEALQKQQNTKRWLRQLEKQQMQYKGAAQAFSSQLTLLEDHALHDLDQMAQALEEYISMNAPTLENLGEAPRPKGFGGNQSFAAPPPQPAESPLPSPFASYRAAPPTPARRRRAQHATPPPETPCFTLPRIERKLQSHAIAELNFADPPPPTSTISVAPGSLASTRVYLERCDPIDHTDSGWYLAPAPETGPAPDRRELTRIPLADFLALRPDLDEALKLAPGSLIVVEGARVCSITAPNDTLLFHAEPPQ